MSRPDPTLTEYARLGQYCRHDVAVERAIVYWCGNQLPPQEWEYAKMDRAMNERGFAIDVDLLDALMGLADMARDEINREFEQITGLASTTALPRFKSWLRLHGAYQPGDKLGANELVELLDEGDLPPEVHRAVQLRAWGSKSSLAKLKVAADQMHEGRLKDQFVFLGASGTGRYSARAWQPQNIPRDMLPQEAVGALLAGDVPALEAEYGPLPLVLTRALRLLIVAGPGQVLTGGDYSQIESRLVAWLAGVEWKLSAYAEGRDVYRETAAAALGGVPLDEVTDEQRQMGKVQDLSLGFQGGWRALANMGRNYGLRIGETAGRNEVRRWRTAHPEIVKTWGLFDSAALRCVGRKETVELPRGLRFEWDDEAGHLWMRLPTGRRLAYLNARVVETRFGWSVVCTNWKRGSWQEVSLYGGLLFQNAVQALGREVLVDAMHRVWLGQWACPVLTVHDEVVVEGKDWRAMPTVELLEDAMLELPRWAEGLPLDVECWSGGRYGK